MLLVTDSKSVERLIVKFNDRPLDNISLCGIVFVDGNSAPEKDYGIPKLADIDDCAAYICCEWIDEVYIGVSDESRTPRKQIDQCRLMGVTIQLQMVSLGYQVSKLERKP